jgi:hypothetical protein
MLCVLAAAGVLGAATLASAAGPAVTKTGKVKSVDWMSHTVTFEDGSTYKIQRGVSIKSMKPGQRVTLTFSALGGPVREVSSIAPALD